MTDELKVEFNLGEDNAVDVLAYSEGEGRVSQDL